MKLLNLDGKDSDSPINLELKVIKEANSNKGKNLIFPHVIIFVENHNEINAIRILQGKLISHHTHLT